MNRSELVSTVAARMPGMSKLEIDRVLGLTIEEIRRALIEGENVALRDLATFELRSRKARKGRNPSTGEEVQIPAYKYVGMRTSASLRKEIKS